MTHRSSGHARTASWRDRFPKISAGSSTARGGNPCHETASAPATRYSTSFEFKHSINSRKSLLKGIGVGSLPQFEEYRGPLLRGHLGAGKSIGGVGFLKAVENADYFLHNLILAGCSTSGSGLAKRVRSAASYFTT